MFTGAELFLLLVTLRRSDDQHADIDHMAASIILREPVKHGTDLGS